MKDFGMKKRENGNGFQRDEEPVFRMHDEEDEEDEQLKRVTNPACRIS